MAKRKTVSELEAAFDKEIAAQMESVKAHATGDLKGIICLTTSLMRDAQRGRVPPEGYVEALGVLRREMQSCLLAVNLLIRGT